MLRIEDFTRLDFEIITTGTGNPGTRNQESGIRNQESGAEGCTGVDNGGQLNLAVNATTLNELINLFRARNGDMEKYESMEIWKYGSMEVWKDGSIEI